MDFSSHRKDNISLVIYLLCSRTLSSSPYFYQEFISCVDDVALRSRHIDRRSEGNLRILEKIISKDTAFLCRRQGISFVFFTCTAKDFLFWSVILVGCSIIFLVGRGRKCHDTLAQLIDLGDRNSLYSSGCLQVRNGVSLGLYFIPKSLYLLIGELIYIDIGELIQIQILYLCRNGHRNPYT